MPDSAERFLANAEECRHRSQRALTETHKANWLTIAENWVRLADWVRSADGWVPEERATATGSQTGTAADSGCRASELAAPRVI